MNRLIERVRQLREVTGGAKNCGWICSEVGTLLYALVKFQKPDLIIQTGHLWGLSALVCLEALTDQLVLYPEPQNSDLKFEAFVNDHRPVNLTPPIFVSIDPQPETVPNWGAGISLLQGWYKPNFAFMPMKSSEFFNRNLETYKREFSSKNIMGIVDGDHSPEGCLADLESLASIGAKTIFLDDLDWLRHIDDIGRDFAHRRGYHYLPLHAYNGVGILVRHAK